MSWTGTLSIAAGRAIYVGPAGDTAPHAHWAIQAAVGLGGPVRIEVGGTRRRFDGVVVASNVPHALHADDAIVLVYVEPLSDVGAAASAFLGDRDFAALPGETVRSLRERSRSLADATAALAESFGVTSGAGRQELARGRRIEAAIEARLDGRVRLGDVARDVGLSSSRLATVVRRATGLSLRPLVRWCRLRTAVAAVARGATLTEAAHAGGFSDSAHFTRTMRRVFGVAPSAGLRGLRPSGTARRAAPGSGAGSPADPRSRSRRA